MVLKYSFKLFFLKCIFEFAILNECQNYLGAVGGLGGSERSIFLAPLPLEL